MHASLLIGVLLLFSRHVPAAPSLNDGDSSNSLDEPPGQQAAAGGILHIDVHGRNIQKRYDDGSWHPDKYSTGGGTQSLAKPPKEHVGAPPEVEPTVPSNEEPTPSAKTKSPEEKPTTPAKTEDKKKEEKEEKKKDDTEDCAALINNKYLFRQKLVDAVTMFCKDADKQSVRDENSGGIDRRYFGGEPDEVIIGVDWEGSDKVNNHDCLQELTRLIDNCSVPGLRDNEHNVKAGGTRYAGVFAYRIEPIFQRVDYNEPKKAKCKCDKLGKGGAHIDCYISGRGFANGDGGQGLKDNAMGCGKWGNDAWYFRTPADKDSQWEWEARAQLHLRKSSCLWRAMGRVGGPDNFSCTGNGADNSNVELHEWDD